MSANVKNGWRRVKGCVAIALIAVAACSPAQLRDLGEDLGRRGEVRAAARIAQQAMPISAETERQIGFEIAAGVAGRYGTVEDATLLRYLALVGNAVAQQSPRYGEIAFHFGLLDTDDVNAFAAPGGFIYITRGALALMRSEAELAAVLAHEVAHVDQRHVLDEIRRSAVLQQVRDESQLEGELLDRAAEAGTSVLFMGLSREDELEADSLAVMYAAATGYAPDGLLHFLSNLHDAQQTGVAARLRELAVSHPSADDRITARRPQVEQLQAAYVGVRERERFVRMVGAYR